LGEGRAAILPMAAAWFINQLKQKDKNATFDTDQRETTDGGPHIAFIGQGNQNPERSRLILAPR
jgi:hypothetical protein